MAVAGGVLLGAALPVGLPAQSRAAIAWAGPLLLAGCLASGGTAREWAGAGWLFGVGYFGTALAWLVTLVRYSFLAPPGYLALVAYAALYPALACVALHPLRGSRLLPLALPAAFAASDFARVKLLWGFPWAGYAWTQAFVPLAAAPARLGGEFAVDFILFAPAGAVLAFRNRRLFPCALATLALAVILVAAGSSVWEGGGGERMTYLLVQGNVPIPAKWDPRGAEVALERHRLLSGVGEGVPEGPPDLIVWPETAVGGELSPGSRGWTVAEETASETGAHLLVGGFLPGRRLLRNGAVLFGPDGVRGEYAKRRLVPFGEHLPGSGWLPPRLLALVAGRNWEEEWLEPGDSSAPLLVPLRGGGEAAVGVLVCYESTMSELARRYRRDGAECLVTVTNDAWSAWPDMMWQHAAGSTLRAVETGLPLLCCANTGVTMAADPDGTVRVLARGDQADGVTGALRGTVALGGGTPYAAAGDLFSCGCIGFVAVVFASALARARRADVK